MATESLTCQNGKGHKWTRERTRGRKPRFCPKHKPAIETSAPVQSSTLPRSAVKLTLNGNTTTLPCEIGKHNWERPSQRGRKPSNCPEHSIVKPVSVPRVKRVASSTKDSGDGLATVTNIDDYKEQRELLELTRQAREAKARKRIDNLEMMLRSRNLHLSQQPDWQAPIAPEIEQALTQPVKAEPKKRTRKKTA